MTGLDAQRAQGAAGGSSAATQPGDTRTVQSTGQLAGGGTVVRYTDGSQTIRYTDGVVDEISKDGTTTTIKPGQNTVVRHPDGKMEEIPPLLPLQIQALVDQARCFQQVHDAIQQTDAATTGTPVLTPQSPFIYSSPPSGQTPALGFPPGSMPREIPPQQMPTWENMMKMHEGIPMDIPLRKSSDKPGKSKKDTPWEIPPK